MYAMSEGAGSVQVVVRVLEGMLGKSFDVRMATFRHGPIGEILGEAVNECRIPILSKVI